MGEDLYSQDELCDMGVEVEWKFDGEPADTDVVCLFDTLAEAVDFRQVFAPDHKMLEVTISDDEDELTMVTVSEGYTAVVRRIPSRCIRVIS
jgi:hypothetical protein